MDVDDYQWQTLPQLFAGAVARAGDRIAYNEKIGGTWQRTSFRRLDERVRGVARFLVDAGVAAGDRTALICKNCTEWAVLDMGMQHAAAVNVPIYPSSSPDQILYILNDSGAKICFVQDAAQLEKVRQIRDRAAGLERVVVIRPEGVELGDGERGLPEIEAAFAAASDADAQVAARVEALGMDDLASFVYTSGTTGDPKGVMLTQKNFAHNIEAAGQLIKMDETDHHLSFLPLSHVFERTVGYYVPLIRTAQVHFAESQEKLLENLKEVRPTFMTSVPRLYEKIRDGMIRKANAAGGVKTKIFHWAVESGKVRARYIQGGAMPGIGGRAAIWLADKLVFDKVREAFGGRLRFFLSGGAPLAPELGEFFLGAGVKVLEGYGLTETSPMIAANTPDLIRVGTVGPAVWGVEIKIAEDGEICARGPNIMRGYWNKDEATREVIDADGWFHTGDIGEFTAENCLRITDRKKNLLVLSNGKNVAPAPIENMLINSPYIAQSVVLGDNRKFVSALVVPDHGALERHAKEHLGFTGDREALCASPKVLEFMMAEVKRLTGECNPYEVPKKVYLLREELSEAKGELTPTLKVKRKVVLANYKDAVDGLYA